MEGIKLCDVIITTVLAVIIIAGNSMAILAAWMSRGRKNITSKRLILNLNISDLFVGLVVIFVLIIKSCENEITINKLLSFLRIFSIICSYTASEHSVLTVAIDRYVVIAYPLLYQQYMSKNVINAMIFISWGTASLLSITFATIFTSDESEISDKIIVDNNTLHFSLALSLDLLHLIIWIAMVILYFKIWIKARALTQRLKASTESIGIKNNDFNNNKTNKVILTILGCCSLCWLPNLVVGFIFLVTRKKLNDVIVYLVNWIMTSKSAINPLIYAWMCPTYRKAFHRMFKCDISANHHLRSQGQQTNIKLGSKKNSDLSNNVANKTISYLVDNCEVVK